MNHEDFLKRAIEVARSGMNSQKGGPFGALVVKNNQIIAEASNGVTSLNDPTAHAEIQAIRAACKKLESFQLDDCIIYSSCEPCPMCLGAIYWARPKAVYFAATRQDAAAGGFDDEFIYKEILIAGPNRKIPFLNECSKEGATIFPEWNSKQAKVRY
jgi:guanine deaminase